MDAYLAPAIVVALIGIIIQGIKALLDLIDRAKARETSERQSRIALCVALMGMVNVMSVPEGAKVEYKESLIKSLLSDMLTEDINQLLRLTE